MGARPRLNREMHTMADKWVDFLISAVEFSEPARHIARLAMHLHQGDKVGPKMIYPDLWPWRGSEPTYMVTTIYTGNDKKWQKGTDVAIPTGDAKPCIRTLVYGTAQDNLGDLTGF